MHGFSLVVTLINPSTKTVIIMFVASLAAILTDDMGFVLFMKRVDTDGVRQPQVNVC